MEEKITIIEGPPPTFEAVNDNWTLGLVESSVLSDVAITRLRTFNGPALVERCYRAWHSQQPIHLEFKTEDGMEHAAPIVAARYVETDEGDMLLLWVRLPKEDMEYEITYDDGEDLDDLDDLEDLEDFDEDLEDLEDFEDDDFDEDEGPNIVGPADWTL